MKYKDKNLLDNIWHDLQNYKITERELANKYGCTERTIRRYIKILKNQNMIKLEGKGTKSKWVILKQNYDKRFNLNGIYDIII